MEMNNQSIQQFRKDFADAVKALEEKYDVDISLGRITYDFNSFHGTLTTNAKGADKAEWIRYCGMYGFKPEDYGKTFDYKNRKYTITGIKSGSKYPISAVRDDGKDFNFSPDAITFLH